MQLKDSGTRKNDKETPCGYTWMPRKQGKIKETPSGYTWMPRKQGKIKEMGKAA